jgi:hypothetical protein
MADNIQVSQGIGTTMATDDVAGVQYPRVKLSYGVDGSAVDASSANPLPVVGPLTDTELRAVAVPVSVSGVATAANQATSNGSLSSIDTKTPSLDNSKQPVVPSMTSGGNLSVQTAAIGTDWSTFASQALKQLTVSNQTGTNIEFRQDGAGVGFIVPVSSIFTFFGITNSDQIEARRVDTSNTQVTVTARWES